MRAKRRLRAVPTVVDVKFQKRIREVLDDLERLYAAGLLDGLYVMTMERSGKRGEKPLLTHRRAAIADGEVSFGAINALLAQHLEYVK